eukprot:SAG31_NODE_1385_length_8573_cov_27.673118_2_plen_211_part_00
MLTAEPGARGVAADCTLSVKQTGGGLLNVADSRTYTVATGSETQFVPLPPGARYQFAQARCAGAVPTQSVDRVLVHPGVRPRIRIAVCLSVFRNLLPYFASLPSLISRSCYCASGCRSPRYEHCEPHALKVWSPALRRVVVVGLKLTSDTDYAYTVSCGGASANSTFSTGLLEQSDWHGVDWIGGSEGEAVLLRKVYKARHTLCLLRALF